MEYIWNFIIHTKDGKTHYDKEKLNLILRCLYDKTLLQETSKNLYVGVDSLYLYINYFNKLKNLFDLKTNIIELGFGGFTIMSFLIDHEQTILNSGSITAYDAVSQPYNKPDIDISWQKPIAPLGNIQYKFSRLNRNTILPDYDLIFGIKTCSGLTEIVRLANRDKKDFFLVPCDCYTTSFVNYLYNIAKEGTDKNSEIIIDDSLNKSFPILARRKIK